MLMAIITGGDPSSAALAAALRNPAISLLTPEQRAQLERIQRDHALLGTHPSAHQALQQGLQTSGQPWAWTEGGNILSQTPGNQGEGVGGEGEHPGSVVAVAGGRGKPAAAGGRAARGDSAKDLKDLSSWCCYRRLGESFTMLDVGLDAGGNVVDIRGVPLACEE